jgi:hypothetical protein
LILVFAGMLGCADPPPAEPPDGFVPELLYVAGAFAYDPVEDEAIPYSVDGEVAPIRLDVTVIDRRYFEAGDSAWRCDLTATTTSRAPRAPWATDAGVAFGFTLPTDAAWEGVCPDPTTGEVRVERALADDRWGLGIGALDLDVERWLTDTIGGDGDSFEEDWAPWVVGGGFYWSALGELTPGGYAPNDYATAADAPDGSLTLDADGRPTLLPAEQAVAEPLPPAAFAVELVYGVDLAALGVTLQAPLNPR